MILIGQVNILTWGQLRSMQVPRPFLLTRLAWAPVTGSHVRQESLIIHAYDTRTPSDANNRNKCIMITAFTPTL